MATVTNAAVGNETALRAILAQGIAIPVAILAMLSMVVLPLPPLVLDVLFTFNIALSVMVLIAVFSVRKPLDFAIFPTVLLMTTIFRLALNVASTRVVLLNGHTGTEAAGHVIESFGQFVIGGNYAVGIVVFVILTIINFVVITKGSGRVSEVTARFTLDAMPGKQMAIDADLNAGLLTQDEARARRAEVRAEADFYGSMDGASKFVRGDAIAGILILIINLLGGLVIGPLMHDMALGAAAERYTLLAIGDGLVAQIPALLLSTAVAVIVTRMSRDQDMGGEVTRQLVGDPKLLGIAAGVIGILGLVPGMPNVMFLSMAGLCAYGAFWMSRRNAAAAAAEAARGALEPAPASTEKKELSWEDVRPVDLIGLEVGYRLVSLVDKEQGGQLLPRIRGVRLKLSQELGYLVPAVHIRDNLELAPNAYRIQLAGVPVAEGTLMPDRELAINPGRVFGLIDGIETRDPAFGMEAFWITEATREQAQSMGYTVVDATTVVATHLSQVIGMHAHEILGHEEVQQLLTNLGKSSPKLVEDLVPKTLPLSVVVKVLQGLLSERVSIRNLRTILETLAEHSGRTQDPQTLVAHVRVALARQIIQDIAGNATELPVVTFDGALEQMLTNSVASGAATPGLEPGLAERLQGRLQDVAQRQEMAGQPAVLLVSPTLRPVLARFLRSSVPQMQVIAWNEIPDNRKVRLVSTIGT
jgi:flagellar biosynthesis protein FlhA